MTTETMQAAAVETGFPLIYQLMLHGVEPEGIASLLAPGVYPDLSMEDYLALPYMSASRIEKLRRSPLQLLASLDAPPKVTPALERGTALHLAVLEPDLFEGHYITIGACRGILKSGKREGEECGLGGSVYRDGKSFCGTHDPQKGEPMDPDINVLAEGEHEKVIGMRNRILAHPRAASLFEGEGAFETTIIFDDPETGVRCKVRPDRLVRRAGMNVDIKSTKDATPHAFANDAERRGYWRKLALYRRALRLIEWPYRTTSVLAIEPEAPFDLIPYLVDESDLDGAEREISSQLWVYRNCYEERRWRGYTDEFKPLSRPSWASEAA